MPSANMSHDPQARAKQSLRFQCLHTALGTLGALQRHHWQGNVRELQNVVERAVLLGKGDTLDLYDLPPEMRVAGAAAGGLTTGYAGQTLKEALEGPERQIILEVLELNHWNRNETADQLGINRTTLYKKMKRLGLEERAGAEG